MHTSTTPPASPASPHLDIAALSVTERIELAEVLWESVRAEIEAAPLTREQMAEIERRCADIDSGAVQCVPFDSAMRRLRGA